MMEVIPMTTPTLPQPNTPNGSSGGRLVSADGRELPLVSVRLTTSARGGVAEVTLEQRFRNPYDAPLAVTYSFGLPSDAAVSGYEFAIGGRRVVGEIDRRQAARERFEQAVLAGRTAGLVEQDRSSLFTQEIGNLPPRAEVVAKLTIDQRLRWLPAGSWEWRFPTTVAPRYLGAAGRVPDAERVTQDVADGPLAPRLELSLAIRDALAAGGAPESPSHRLRQAASSAGVVVTTDEGGVPLDRDLVVRWPVAAGAVGLSVDVASSVSAAAASSSSSVYGLLTIVPPAPAAQGEPVARDLIVLLDTSGSMGGEPLDQARRVVSALVETLGERDRLEMIEFSSAPRRWRPEPVAVGATAKREALAWLAGLRAAGGTEMRSAILEALEPLRAESQRQILLVTDGLIGFEMEVVAAIDARLPASSRVHTLGVGSAVNRSLTAAAARAGRGREVLVGLGEDAERAARAMVAATDAPLVVDLVLGGSALLAHAPRRLPDLFAGAPALVGLSLRPEGGAITVRGRTAAGEWSATCEVAAAAPGSGSRATVKLYARELVEDLEMRRAAGEGRAATDAEIERIGLEFQVATRLTSWVAISEEPAVDPGAPVHRVRMPQELPHGMSAEGLGLRGVPPAGPAFAVAAAPAAKGLMFGGPSRSRGGASNKTAQATVRARGRVKERSGAELVVEIDRIPLVHLKAGDEVELVWADGRRARAKVLESTHPGPGRITVELDPGEPLPQEIVIATATELITVTL
jgi:Ca-activated chloride channel family protein